MASDSAEAAYAKACAELACGDTCAAIASLGDAIEEHPDDAKLWSLRGVALWSIGVVDDSIASLETALTLAPLDIDGRLALALGYEVIQKHELATNLYDGLLEENDLPYRVLEPLARALGRANQPGLALQVCQKACRQRPDEVGPLRGVVFYMDQLGRGIDEILPVLFRALHLDPESFDTRLTLAQRLCSSGRSSEAAYLLSDLPIESSRCPRCLIAMQAVFVEAGDEVNAARCVAALATNLEGARLASNIPAV